MLLNRARGIRFRTAHLSRWQVSVCGRAAFASSSRSSSSVVMAQGSGTGNIEGPPGLMDKGVKSGFIDAVGNTPLIRLNGVSDLTGCNIYGKAEYCNPGGSVKGTIKFSDFPENTESQMDRWIDGSMNLKF